jgi:hypothetical protein
MTASASFLVMVKFGKTLRVKSASKYKNLVSSDEAEWANGGR